MGSEAAPLPLGPFQAPPGPRCRWRPGRPQAAACLSSCPAARPGPRSAAGRSLTTSLPSKQRLHGPALPSVLCTPHLHGHLGLHPEPQISRPPGAWPPCDMPPVPPPPGLPRARQTPGTMQVSSDNGLGLVVAPGWFLPTCVGVTQGSPGPHGACSELPPVATPSKEWALWSTGGAGPRTEPGPAAAPGRPPSDLAAEAPGPVLGPLSPGLSQPPGSEGAPRPRSGSCSPRSWPALCPVSRG